MSENYNNNWLTLNKTDTKMVEEVKNQDFIPTEEEKALIARHLGQGVVVDTGYKKTVNLSLEEADARARCVSDTTTFYKDEIFFNK